MPCCAQGVPLPSRRSLLRALHRIGVFGVGRRLLHSAVPVLTYHHVVPDGLAPAERPSDAVPVSEFMRQVEYLVSNHRLVDGAAIAAFASGARDLPPHAALITFDDGYLDNYEHAFPILEHRGAPAVFFVTSDFLDDPDGRLWFERLDQLLAALPEPALSAWLAARPLPGGPPPRDPARLRQRLKRTDRETRDRCLSELETLLPRNARIHRRRYTAPMSWAHAREMAAAGMTIGAHTATHQVLAAESAGRVRDELTTSRARIERELGIPCRCFSYPNGERDDVREEDAAAVAQAGFACAFTQVSGFVTRHSDRYRLPRIPVPSAGGFEAFLSRVTGIHLAWQAIADW